MRLSIAAANSCINHVAVIPGEHANIIGKFRGL